MHLQYESAGLRTMRVHIIILDAGYTYLYIREGFARAHARALSRGIRRGIFMAYCNALGNFVINVKNGGEGGSMIAPSAQSVSLFYQIFVQGT